LGNPYDTSLNNVDWWALVEWETTWKATLKNNFTWKTIISDKKPFVCTDLIIDSLSQMWLKSNIPLKSNDKFDWRRISEVEKAVSTTSKFKIEDCNVSVKYPENSIEGKINCRVWDIITISNPDNGWRHVWIVTKVDWSGLPLLVIHSSWYRGVVETPFLNSKQSLDYKNKKRYDGFLYWHATVDKIIRPNKMNMMIALLNVKSNKISASKNT